MLFCTYGFAVFFVAVLLGLKAAEGHPRWQQVLLLVASNVFYGMWDWRFLVLIWFSTLLDFTVGCLLEVMASEKGRKLLLACSLLGNLGILCVFKYLDFLQASAQVLLASLGVSFDPRFLDVVLPVGISFYTFQTLAYTIDVFRRRVPACRDLLVFGQYVCYFPQLVAGPIERASHLIPQLRRTRVIESGNLLSGLLLIVWGCFKKATIADSLGLLVVDPMFGNPQTGTHLILGILGFSIQIYCDFSGYCDIARGASRCLGIELVENFHAPYFAPSISSFWRRWHMSLSNWFRDYLYTPLGGNRRGRTRTMLNLWATMFLCGLWHGAAATFVIWGCYHGCLLLIHRLLAGDSRRLQETWGNTANRLLYGVKVLGTFALVCYGWMIFRLDDLGQLADYSVLLLDPLSGFIDPATRTRCVVHAALVAGASAAVCLAHWIQVQAVERNRELEDLEFLSSWQLGGAVAGVSLVVLLFSTFGKGGVPFIYFQF